MSTIETQPASTDGDEPREREERAGGDRDERESRSAPRRDAAARKAADAPTDDAKPDGESDERPRVPIEQVLLRELRFYGPLAVVVATAAAGYFVGPGTAVLVLAAAAFALAIGAMWSSVRALAGETPLSPEDALALGTPSAEEEQKRAVLRALKDIEFELAVGKISEDDFKVLRARYRAEAKRLLQKIEEQAAPERARVERLLERRLVAEGLAAAGLAAEELAGEGPAEEDVGPVSQPAEADAPQVCEACGTGNDGDARFCKKCGSGLEREEAAS